MLQFPEWSDLGNISDETRLTWQNEMTLRSKYRRYFDGTIFHEKIPLENPTGDEQPLLYPIGLNLVKMICLAQTDAVFGEWEDQAVNFVINTDHDTEEDAQKAVALLNKIYKSCNANSALWEVELDRNVYGAGVLKISPSLDKRKYVSWGRIPLNNFFPVFNPDDPNDLLEAYVVTYMTSEQAAMSYGTKPTGTISTRVEHWTKRIYETRIDGAVISPYSGINPWGVVPFVYIPRLRSHSWFGDPLTEELIPVQDELNMRIADLGDAINYNAHPTRWGYNLPRNFNTENYSIGPNSMWDLGRVIGQSPEPKVGILEAHNPIPQGTFDYINFLYDWARMASFAPPIAFGQDSGGQRSGVTLELRMWSLIKAARRSRAYLSEGLSRAIWITGKILEEKQFDGIPARPVKIIVDGVISPSFAEIMPKDHAAIVDEIVKLRSLDIPAISLETSQKNLGRPISEVSRIKKELQDKELHPDPPQTAAANDQPKSNDVIEGVKGKNTPQPKKDS